MKSLSALHSREHRAHKIGPGGAEEAQHHHNQAHRRRSTKIGFEEAPLHHQTSAHFVGHKVDHDENSQLKKVLGPAQRKQLPPLTGAEPTPVRPSKRLQNQLEADAMQAREVCDESKLAMEAMALQDMTEYEREKLKARETAHKLVLLRSSGKELEETRSKTKEEVIRDFNNELEDAGVIFF
jgi:hypothetical protein